MSNSSSLISRAWIVVLILCVCFLIGSDWGRIRRAEFVNRVGQEAPAISADSPTGYAGGTRELVVPEHLDDCYDWIRQTQQMLAVGDWRIRRVDYENAPFGRAVHRASLYRWWIGGVTWADHLVSGRPVGASVEHAALLADPLLHLLLLVATTLFVARWFGSLPAIVTAVGMVTLFPFAAGFLPSVPEDYSAAIAMAVWCVLPLVAALRMADGVDARAEAGPSDRTASCARRLCVAAGVAGGVEMWLNVAVAVPLLVGIAFGGLLASWVSRATRADDGRNQPVLLWRASAVSGALTVLAGYLIEYFPAHLGEWELRAIHPLYGIAWLGGGEVLIAVAAWIQRTKSGWRARDFVVPAMGVIALATVPVAMWKTGSAGFLAFDLLSFRLTKQIDAVLAPNGWQWLTRGVTSPPLLATMLPVAALALTGWLVLRKTTAEDRRALAFVLGPAVVLLVLAGFRLRTWQTFDAVWLVAAAATTATVFRPGATAGRRAGWLVVAGGILAFGFFQLAPSRATSASNELSLPEVEGLVERDLAQWLAYRRETPADTVILAPPGVTPALSFYGGGRGLASLSWENKDGLSVALRIVISTSTEEAQALIRRRGVTHIVMPTWDRFYEQYTRAAAMQNGAMFFVSLGRWSVPPWLRPLAYPVPKISGFEDQRVVVFEVVDEQDEPVALSRLAEYFLEMGWVDQARAAEQDLRRFPADLGALVARAQVAYVRHESEAFNGLIETIARRITAGGDRVLPWDRRVSLAALLARARRMELARAQVECCIAQIDAARVRSLSPYALVHLSSLSRAFGLSPGPAAVRDLIQDLLPADAPATAR